jgi:hypothetical protein
MWNGQVENDCPMIHLFSLFYTNKYRTWKKQGVRFSFTSSQLKTCWPCHAWFFFFFFYNYKYIYIYSGSFPLGLWKVRENFPIH